MDAARGSPGQRRPPVSAPPIVAAALAAINSGDREAFLGCFVEAGSVDDLGSVHRGREAISSWWTATRADRRPVDVLTVSVVGARTIVWARVGDGAANTLQHLVFERIGDHLVGLTIAG